MNDAQWELLQPFVRGNPVGPQPVVYSRREVVNTLLYVSRTGVRWRYLPHDLHDWRSVYSYFRQWKKDGTRERLHDVLRGKVRKQVGRSPQPTAGILDSQPAEVQDRDATAAVLPLATEQFPMRQEVWADAASQGPRVESIAQQAGVEVEGVKHSDKDRGFVLQARRWVVERTLAWLSRERRLARDYDRMEESSEAFVSLGMIRRMLGRLA